MVDVVTELTIEAPIETVAAFSGDPSNVSRWYRNISSVEWLTPQRTEVGARVAFVARFLGRTLRYTYEIVEYAANERLVMRTAEGPFPMETTYTWTAVSDTRTRMTLRNHGEPAGFSKILAPLMTPAMRRANRKDLAMLASILEAR